MKINMYKVIFTLIIVTSIVFRIFIIEQTPLGDNSQYDTDMGNPSSINDYEKLFNLDNYKKEDHGHLYYILYIFENHKLCDDTEGQTYHPPVHYIITATWLSTINLFNLNAKQKIEGIQYIGLIYFCLSIIIINKLLNELEISKKSKLLILFLYSFFPKFLQMAILISNDYLAFVFMLGILLYLVKWNKESSYKNTIILSILFGLGVLTKYNTVVMIIPIGMCFFKQLLEKKKNVSDFSNIFLKIIIFSFIVFIFSISYIARCIILFNNYKIAIPYEHLYIGNVDFWERWGLNLGNLLLLKYDSQNMISGFLCTTLICGNTVNYFIGSLNLILIIYGVYYIYSEIKKEKNFNIVVLIITFISYWCSFIIFNIRLPYICTYDSRYILISLFLALLFIGKSNEKISNNILKKLLVLVIVLFNINSILMFL